MVSSNYESEGEQLYKRRCKPSDDMLDEMSRRAVNYESEVSGSQSSTNVLETTTSRPTFTLETQDGENRQTGDVEPPSKNLISRSTRKPKSATG